MARPRVFVSSTYYDLKHIRASLDAFINSLGFEAILSEKGEIAYRHDIPLDESCYREVRTVDLFVLIVGGRYGSPRSGQSREDPSFFDRYDSVTKLEYKAAVEQDIPVYVFVERAVYAEYQTFLRNSTRRDIEYAHVDSLNVFRLIQEILAQPRNNPLKEFDRFRDIEDWLRDQWSGLFKDLLLRTSSQRQLAGLQAQIANLAEIGNTLRTYLEEVVQKVAPQKAEDLIKGEHNRLEAARLLSEAIENPFVRWALRDQEDSAPLVIRAIANASSFSELAHSFEGPPFNSNRVPSAVRKSIQAQADINKARELLGLSPLLEEVETDVDENVRSDHAFKATPPRKPPAKNKKDPPKTPSDTKKEGAK